MRYITLAEAFVLAEAVTGIDAATLRRISRTNLLDSALHAPQASFGDQDAYPDIYSKAAVLCARIASNHPLLDGNKRLAWESMRFFCDINGIELEFEDSNAIELMLRVATGSVPIEELTDWIRNHATKVVG
ncbi:MAG: type II toxin-antitoxin system death-on-curing family toxin [Ilumatobacteraceae bacterium]